MVRITDDYVIDSDDMSFAIMQDLHTESTDKNGKTRHNYKSIGYYTSFYSALNGLKELFVRKSLSDGEMSLDEACSKVSDINKQFEQMYKEQTE